MAAAMIVLHTFGPLILERAFKLVGDILSGKLVVSTGGDTEHERARQEGANSAISGDKLSDAARRCLPLLRRLHLVIFYLQGRFYHLSKRLTGIHYVRY